VRDVESSLPRPEKELKAFRKITLAAGEKQKVAIQLPRSAFEFYDPAKPEWVAEAGDFEILAGSSSRDIRLRHTFTLSQNLSDK
jgi:beta-glucosidase